jgi:flagellar operon protein (TIGR03826 family)
MDIKNCKRCGKMFSYLSGVPICNECKKIDEEDFAKVKNYLYDNPGSSMQQIAEACEVSVEKITRFLKEGRLEIREGSNVILECEICGKSIKSGRRCSSCTKQLERELSEAGSLSEQETKKEKDEDPNKRNRGMRYLRSE